MEPLDRPVDCDRILLVVNPDSKLSLRGEANIGRLLVQYGEDHRVEPFYTEKSQTATQEKLIEDLRPRDLLLISTGDGGVNMVAEALIKAPELKEDGRNKVPILPIQGGYINLARQQLTPGIFGKKYLAVQALRNGRIIEVNPLEITLSNDADVTQRYIEVLCAGFGLTGSTIHHLENGGRKSFREKNILSRELASGIAAVRAFMTVEPFTVEQEMDGETHSESVRELSFTNSQKVGRFSFTTKLTDPEFLAATVPEKRRKAAAALIKLLIRHPAVERIEGFDSVTVTLRTTNGKNIKMQIGGERGEVTSGTTATVRRLKDTVRFVTLNPKLQKTS